MKPSDLLNLPDEHAYRLVDVKRIFRYRDGFHDLSLYFQRIENAYELIHNYENEVPDKPNIKSFSRRVSIEFTANVEFTRCFVIGSIWWRDRFPMLPNYFGEFDIYTNFLKFSKPPQHFRAHEYLDLSFLPKHDSNSVNYLPRPDISVYELDTPLMLYSLDERNHRFSTIFDESPPKYANFIAFHNYEIYRYFLTAKGEGTLNQRFLTSEILINQKSKNHVFDPISSRTEIVDGEEHNLVYLKNYADKRNTELIGNVVFNHEFKSKMNHVRRMVQVKASRTFGENIYLPISQFEKMKFVAKWVKKRSENPFEDDVWGLLVFQIQECKGYSVLDYTPVLKEKEVNPGGEQVVKIKIKKKRKKSGGSGSDYFDHHEGGNPEGETVEMESDELFSLVNPPNETKIRRTKVELSEGDGKLRLITEKELKDKQRVAGPRIFDGDDDQLVNEIKKEVDPIDYFVFFNIILHKLKVSLEINGFSPEVACLNSDFQFVDHILPVHYSEVKTRIGAKDDATVRVFFAQINISGNYFYLLEKERERTSGIDRTWLFALPELRAITMEEIPGIIMGYLFISRKSERAAVTFPDGEFKLDAGLNHKHVRSDQELERIKSEYPNKEINEKLTKEEAIEKHVGRALKKIKSILSISR